VANWTPEDLARLPELGTYLSALLSRSLADTPPADLPVTPQRSVHISNPGGKLAISLDDIIFIKADGDYSLVHTRNGNQHLERRSLRTWIRQLPREHFLRVHQSYLVNGTRIAKLERGPRWTVHLNEAPTPIPVGRAFRHALRLHMAF
jgi:DNA-binding LytR/AlgR family response regulator